MTVHEKEQLERTLFGIWQCVVSDLETRGGRQFREIGVTVNFCDYEDFPWTIRVGNVQGNCQDVTGASVKHLFKRWRMFGVQLCLLKFTSASVEKGIT